ncbi:hypothetical protein ABW21_db0203682 [Orbilia brochopaga]|nr:hypothetical protein ABW21_db0203682 [Drechslerella brochopaga]
MPPAIAPELNPLTSPAVLVHKYIKPILSGNDGDQPSAQEDPMDVIQKGLQEFAIGNPPEVPIKKEHYTIPLDGDYRELPRTMMIKMLRMNLGALHPEKIQRKNEMINEVMLYSWDKVIGVVLWNLARVNPFTNKNDFLRYLDGLWDGFRQMFLDICFYTQEHLDFGEAVCRYLWQSQHQMVQMDLKFLEFYAKVYNLTGHGFYLLNYSHYRESIGQPLGAHREHTLMDRKEVPKIQADFILKLLTNENFDEPGDIKLPMEIIEGVGVLVRILHQNQDCKASQEANMKVMEHIARTMFFGGRQKIMHWVRMSAKSVAFNDLV